jgi:malate dehydrogenase (oxaloacetate-decarboxylating)
MRAHTITDEMAIAAARELAGYAGERGMREDDILPKTDGWEVYPRVAAASGMAAQAQGIARAAISRDALHERAVRMIRNARESVETLMCHGLIIPPPSG